MRRDFQDYDPEYGYSYRRPSVSAWVAAMAVAFAFFVLGGFIKTYRQLEALRDESRREIHELREMVQTMQGGVPAGQTARVQPALTRLPPVAQATANSGGAPAPDAAIGSVINSSRRILDEVEGERPRVTYSIGRSSRREGIEGSEGRAMAQVVAINPGLKRLMVEGGRDAGLEEGTRLELSRQGRWIGDLRVVDVFDTMSACELLHATASPEPGDMVRIP